MFVATTSTALLRALYLRGMDADGANVGIG